MEQSELLRVKIANTNSADEFESYCSRYIRHEDVCSTYYKRYGMLLLSNGTIVAPTQAHWQQFKQDKLDTLQPSPDTLFTIFQRHDMRTIRSLATKHKVGCVAGSQHGNPNVSLYIKDSGQDEVQHLGDILVERNGSDDQFETRIVKTSLHDLPEASELAPVITFLEDVMRASADGSSAHRMIENVKWYPMMHGVPSEHHT